MTLHTPNQDVPDQGRMLAKIHADLSAYIAPHGGTAYIAESADESFYFLANGPGQFIVTLHLASDRPEYGGGPRITDPIIESTIILRVFSNAGFDMDRGSSAAIDKPGSRALLWIVSEVRRRMLAYRISPNIVNHGELYYAGMRPLVLPDGQPLRGYELTFTCFQQMSLADRPEEFQPIEL